MEQENSLHAGPGDGAVSRPQLERLEAQRQTPHVQRTLTPGLGGTHSVEVEEARRRDGLIDHIRGQIDARNGQASRDFALGQVRHRAKRDFDRER